MEYKDYYQALGVPRTASQAEIKKAFRSLARKHHPDVAKGDAASESRFKDVNEAYEVLGDPEKRARYDQLGADWEQVSRDGAGGPFGGFGGFQGGGFPGGGFPGGFSSGGGAGPGGIRYEFRTSGGDASGFSDFFRMFFGGEGPASSGDPGDGRGASGFGGGFGGLGDLGRARGRSRAAAKPGPVEVRTDVSLEEAFHGTARLVEVDGKRLEVQVPRGVDEGSRIRLKGKGGGSGAEARDLVLVTHLLPHAVFTRKGADLTRDLSIELREALLGGEVRVPTLGGAVLLRIPAGTQPGRTFRLTGQGMPKLNAEGRGDLLVRIGIRIPTLTDERDRRAAEVFLDALERPGTHHGAPV